MKAILLLIQCIAFTFSAQAWAVADSQSCENRSQQLRGAAKESFLSSCLSQTLEKTSTPASVQAVTAQSKRKTCEQNAKNMKMEGNKRADYISDCVQSNDAATEARKAGVQEHIIAGKTTRQQNVKAATAEEKRHAAKEKRVSKHSAKKGDVAKPKVSLKTCVRNANKEKLKGKERKQFIRDCRKG
ncbi:MAG: PsiF family protein [Gallionella sp.]|nr:PsiF family protein [Gallionella sp.]